MSNNKPIKIAMMTIIALVLIAIITMLILKPIYIKHHLPKPVSINTTNEPTIGNPDAKIHFVVFEDLKCSNCARFSNEIFPSIQKEFIDTGIARYTMINLAFLPGSMPAANAAHCIYKQNPTLFFDYIKAIYKNQPPENENWATIPKLMIIASGIKGINSDQLASCLVQSPYDQLIQNNLKEAIKVMNRNVATPTLYINGIKVEPLTMSHIKEMVSALK